MLEDDWIQKSSRIQGEIDSGSYKSRSYQKSSSNIDSAVDRILAKHYGKKVLSSAKKRLPWKQVLGVIIALVVVIAAIPYVLPPLYGDFSSDVSISLDPADVHLNETLFVNVSIPSGYNISRVNMDMVGFDFVNLSLVDNSSSMHLWSGNWLVHDIAPGEHIVTFHALDVDNVSYFAGTRLSVLTDKTIDDNHSIEPDKNESFIPEGLNLTLQSARIIYYVNESVLISGIISFNHSLINTSVDLFIVSPDLNITKNLNASSGRFNYDFIPVKTGDYTVFANVSYKNETIIEYLTFYIAGIPVENVSDNVTEVSIVDPRVDEQVYALPGTSFYVERTINGTRGLDVVLAPLYSSGLTVEKFEIIREENISKDIVISSYAEPRVFTAGKSASLIERRIDNIRETLAIDVKQLNRVSYSPPFSLDGSVTVRVWFKAPSWEDIKSGDAPSSGRISYLTLTDDDFDFESSTWWNSNWNYRKLITINSSQVEVDLTNFPILVNITDSALASKAQDDGDDIAFVLWSDNTTQLNHEIELFNDTSGELLCWVNVTSLSSSEDTKIWMYYNNSGSSSQQNATGVWDSNYLAVWHLNETSGTAYDSTSNNEDSISVVGVTQDANGFVDGCDEFDGSGAYIDFNTNLPSTVTISAWAYSTASSYADMLWCIDSDNQGPDLFYTGNLICLNTWNGAGNPFCNIPTDVDEWHLYSAVIESGNTNLYIDDQLGGSATYRDPTGSDFHISSSAGYDWEGGIDEFRISNIARNTSWINTSYYTMNNSDTFLNLSEEEQAAPIVSDPVPSDGASGTNVPPSFFNITISDPSGDNMNITWRTNESGSWVTFNVTNGGGSGVSDGTYNVTNTSWVDTNLTKYWWSVNVTDGKSWTNNTYNFTTRPQNYVPTLDNIYPANGSTGVDLQVTCYFQVTDLDEDTLTVYWYNSSDGIGYTYQQTNSSISSGDTIYWNYSQANSYLTEYWWKVAINDTKDNVTEWFNFTTRSGDTIKPSSNVSAISPYWYGQSSNPMTITCTDAKDNAGGDGVKNVTLWYRFSTDNMSWDDWISYTTDSSPPWQWSFSFPNGTGHYEFYSIAIDNASPPNIEDAPPTNDTECGYDIVKPSSSVDTIIPYNVTTPILSISSTASDSISGVKNVTLWYRYSSNNFSWWNSGWSNRKPINLNVSSGSTPMDYQVLLNITYDNGMDSNFSDIRFINYSDNTTELDYWIEDKSEGNWANIWVEINNSIVTTNQTHLWMYYGNPSVESNSNGSNTFEFFDNFSGTSLDTATWTATGSATVNNGITITTGSVYTDSTVAASPQNLNFEMKAQYSGADSSYSGLEIADAQSTSGSNGGSNALVYIMTDSGGQDITLWGADGTVSSYNIVNGGSLSPNPTLGTDYIFGYSFYGASQISYFYQNLEYNDIDRATYGGTWSNPFYLWLGYFTGSAAGGTDIDDITVSWIRIRKYSSFEPTYYIGSEENWIKWDNVTNPDEDGSDGWSWNFNFPNGTGHYEFYSISNDTVANQEDSLGYVDARCKFNRIPTISNESPSNGSIDVQLTPQMNITVNDLDGNPMIITWYSNDSGSWQIFGINTSVGNGIYHQTNSNFTSYGKTYWWNVTVNDGFDINTSAIFYFSTESIGPPIVVTNSSKGVEETNATLNGYLQEEGGESCTVRFEYGFTDSYGTNTPNQTKSAGQNFSDGIGSLSPGKLYHFRSFANNSQGSDTGIDRTFLTKPQPPTNLSAYKNNSNIIYINWTVGDGANNTYIERNASGVSVWARGAGTIIYNSSGTNYEDSGLLEGTTYYYQAWSYSNWTYDSTTLYQWSDTYDSANNKTNSIPTVEGEIPANESIDINRWPACNITVKDSDAGDTLDVNFYEYSAGNWILQQTNASVISGSDIVWSNYSNASSYGITYWWSINITDGRDWINETYHFTIEQIETSVDSISPYNITISPLTINSTSLSDIDNITLWYRYSPDNTSWSKWDNNWNYYQILTINSLYIDNSLINFPVLVVINSTVGAKCDEGKSIRFLSTDNITEFYYEIEKWNSSGNSYVWVNISEAIPSDSDYTFLMYYNNSNAIDNQSASNVWDQNYMAVYHLNETSGQHNDSTSNGYDSTTVQVTQQGADIGQADGADEFDGSNDYVALPSNVNPISKITVECWLQSHDNFYQGVWQIVSKYSAYILGTDSGDTNRMEFIIYDTAWRYGNHYSVVDPTVWHYFAGTYDATTTNKYLYVDGNLEESDTNGVGNINNDGGPLHLAHRESDGIGSNHYDGEMDEVRISDIDRNSSWIKATYHTINQTSDFMVWGGEHANVGIGWTIWSNSSNPDFSSPWSWVFNFPNGTGYYEFYSIGKKLGSVDETAPYTADTKCYFNPNTSINVTPSQWDIGITTIGNYNYSTSDFYFNLTNEGYVVLNIQIKASNATNLTTGAQWNLTSTPGFDNYSLQYNKSGGFSWTNINQTYDTFVTNVGLGSWQTFDLNLFMALTSTKSDPLSITITFRSVAV